MVNKIFILFAVSAILSSCTICPSESDFYSLLLNGSWIRYTETIQNYSEILTFIDRENLRLKFQNEKDSIKYRYAMNQTELSLYNNSDQLASKYHVEFINEPNEINIRGIDSLNILNDTIVSIEGHWKRYK